MYCIYFTPLNFVSYFLSFGTGRWSRSADSADMIGRLLFLNRSNINPNCNRGVKGVILSHAKQKFSEKKLLMGRAKERLTHYLSCA